MRQPKPHTLCLCILAVISLTGCHSTFDKHHLDAAKKEYFLKDYEHAYQRLVRLAKRGNPEAQYTVGYMLYYGQGVVEDPRAATFWFNQAAHQGHQGAQDALASLSAPPGPS